MRRDISFNEFGDILVECDTHRDKIVSGVVLLSPEQMQEAEKHGWVEVKPHKAEVELGLTRAKR